MFALRLVGCDNVCCSSVVLSITAGSRRFPAVNSQSISVPFGLLNSKKKKRSVWRCGAARVAAACARESSIPRREKHNPWLGLVDPHHWWSQPIFLGYRVVALQRLQCDLLFGHVKVGNPTMNPELPEGL
jgi:hypothetical protein